MLNKTKKIALISQNNIHHLSKAKSAFLLFLFLSYFSAFSINPVLITEKDIDELHFWKGGNIELLEDLESIYTIDDILSKKYDNKFFTPKADVPLTSKNNVSYWGRIKIKKTTNDDYAWVFEAYDQSTDEFDIYLPDARGKYILYESGDNRLFSQRIYKHKNFVFDLHLTKDVEQIIYIRIKSAHTNSFIGVVRNVHSFIGYALKEYFYLSLFYGLVISLIVFNLMQYFVTRLKIYLIYVFYVFTAALYSSSQDGFGYQFLWYDLYEINNLVQYCASFLVPVLLLFLSYEFIKEINPDKSYIRVGLALVGLRFIYLLINLLGYSPFPNIVIDTLIRAFILFVFVEALYKGNRQLRYFTIAILMLFIGYTIRELTINGLFPNTIATVYMHLLGESFQMLFISLALGERIKIKMENMVISQEGALSELALTQFKTEQLRKNLQKTIEEQIEREKYVSGGISELSNIIANNLNNKDQLYKKIVKFIADYFECRLVALYLLAPGNDYLELSAGYGLDENRLDGIEIKEGEGLLGQCMKEKERIEIHNVPEEYISISSGLGQTTPKIIIIEPLHFNQQFVGAFELASLKELTPLQYEVLEKFTTQISSTLSNVLFNETTRKMLEESIRKEEMLRQQEEEMRQQVEELMATQEGYNRKEEQYIAEIEILKNKNK